MIDNSIFCAQLQICEFYMDCMSKFWFELTALVKLKKPVSLGN